MPTPPDSSRDSGHDRRPGGTANARPACAPSILAALVPVRPDLDVLLAGGADRETLVRIGIALETALAETPVEASSLVQVLTLSLRALQTVYEGHAPHARTLAPAVARSIAAVLAELVAAGSGGAAPTTEVGSGQWAVGSDRCPGAPELPPATNQESQTRPGADGLGQPLTLDQAAMALETALAARPAAHDPPAATLDDAAALLVQLETGDPLGLARLRSVLQRLTEDHSIPSPARDLVAQAHETLARYAVEGGTSQTLDEAGRLLGAATTAAAAAGGENRAAAPATTEAATNHQPPPTAGPLPGPGAGVTGIDRAALEADPELVGEFIAESRDYIAGAETALLALETDAEDAEAVNTVFRAFHTIKGTAAFLGLEPVATLAHRAESLLSRVREREIRCTGGYADLALSAVDLLKALLQTVQDTLAGGPGILPQGYADLLRVLDDPEAAGVSAEELEDSATPLPLGEILIAQGKVDRQTLEATLAGKGDRPLGEALLQAHAASAADVAAALRTQKRLNAARQAGDRAGGEADSTVRVRTDRLDRLIEMVGELVIAHSMVDALASHRGQPRQATSESGATPGASVAQDELAMANEHFALAAKVSHAGKIVRELQDLTLSMRMVPLRTTFQKMARLVRDVAHKTGKRVEFVAEGEETEIDRNLVDVLGDPLVHMVRNAVDHGIESPELRVRQGKPAAGTVRLAAYRAGENVVIELQDNGKGLDREKIVQKALAQGLLPPDKAKGLSDNDVYGLLFAPGFSTADEVTDLSGRGVGLDVVKRNVEALRGRVEVSATPGRGTIFTIRLPLTLAITDGMVVRVGSERYIVPTAMIALSFRPEPSALFTVAGQGELVRLRDELLPLFRLHRLFQVMHAVEDPTQGLLVVLDDGDRRVALLVDELLGQQQVVAKSLGGYIGAVAGVSGAAILGDGRVGLILDAAALTSLARGLAAVA